MLSYDHPMRFLGLLLLVTLAGCPVANERALGANNDDDGAGGGAPPQNACTRDDECIPAAVTCCDCPAFAVNRIDPAQKACTGVMCPGPKDSCPNNVEARCDDHTCVLACKVLACAQSCEAGYAIDENTGCLSCDCAIPVASGCQMDTDCVATRADCCGCHSGGQDTAVLASERASFDASLGCSPSPSCPAVDVCEPGAAPRCVQGRCELIATTGIQGDLCGRVDLPACSGGLVCTINKDPRASLLGVGVCAPPQ
ncbi:MAG: hypothetical protein H0T46_32640 [Deltaproteobacteria bacterium]|nr:hypothetical protein [Deltaproteobacteria bacterium]